MQPLCSWPTPSSYVILQTPLLFKALSSEFKKVMDFAEVRKESKDVVAKYGQTDKFPLVKVFTEAIPEDVEGSEEK